MQKIAGFDFNRIKSMTPYDFELMHYIENKINDLKRRQ